jgi:hypothetical protein
MAVGDDHVWPARECDGERIGPIHCLYDDPIRERHALDVHLAAAGVGVGDER